MLDVGRHPNIELLAYSEVEKIEGQAGDFKVTVRRKARYVEEDKCTGCGACKEKCPTVVSDAFNEGLGERRAIYSWFAQGIPSTHTIDPDHCRQLNGKKCGICKKICKADAINFDQQDKIVDLDVGAIIVATGYDVFDPSQIPEYQYAQIPNVVTAMEFERLLSASGPTGGHLDRPSDLAIESDIEALEKKARKSQKMIDKFEEKYGESSAEFYEKCRKGEFKDDEDRKKWADKYAVHLEIMEPLEALKKKAEGFSVAKKLAFIQCVGSRDFRFYPFCSGYCCMHSIKEAIIAHEHESETTSTIFGMDIRAVGKGFEEYKVRGGNNSNISYVRGRVAEIRKGTDNNPIVVYEDTRERKVKSEGYDLVILATACAPNKGMVRLAEILDIEIDNFGFYKTSAEQPLDTARHGIFVCGCAHGPMDIPESVAQASSAAARAVQILTASEEMRQAS
ncbi:MAG: 4Fe-4S binding protein [Deltaproteobacteria bacterium]|nr:4Fe-4S binding protein [Deltaproteobacteria bacterium]MBW2143071.1 4Fe-4S binding protein [Deltaproteobacteria bacterium]